MGLLLTPRTSLFFGALLSIGACGQVAAGDSDGIAGSKNGEGSGGKVFKSGGASGDDDDESIGSGGKKNTGGGSPSDGGQASATGGKTSADGGGSSVGGNPEPNGPLEAIWYYDEADGLGQFTNILAPKETLLVPGGLALDQSPAPWSSDGKHVAILVEGEILFYELETEEELIGRYAADYTAIFGWIQGVGAVVTGSRDNVAFIAVALPGGDELLLDEGDPLGSSFTATVAPGGDIVVWIRSGTDGFSASFASFTNGLSEEPKPLAHFTGSPLLSTAWSSDGRWFSFGISAPSGNDEGGIYLWGVGSEAPVRVSPPGAGYNPLYSFSNDASKFVLYTSDEVGGAVYAVGLPGDEPGPAVRILGGVGVSPATWNPFGSIALEGVDGGALVPIGVDGLAGTLLPFESFKYGCNVFWVSETKFFHTGCGELPTLTLGTVAATIEEEAVLSLTNENYGLSRDRACFVEWSPTGLRVGSTDDQLHSPNTVPVSPPPSSVGHVDFAPDGRSLVWMDEGARLYRSELKGCVPQGDSILIRELAGEVTSTVFVTPAL